MWDEASGTFLAVQRDTMEKGAGGHHRELDAAAVGHPDRRHGQADGGGHPRPTWQTPLPVPTVDRNDKRWVPDSYWRGDVWPAPNYRVATALRGTVPRIAAGIADKTVANALKNGVNEHYNSVTGKTAGGPIHRHALHPDHADAGRPVRPESP